MLKYFVLFVVMAIVWWRWREASRRRGTVSPQQPPVERMVACAHCGVNQPLSESLAAGERFYCCDAHRRLGEEFPNP
ncbi:MAG: PP0621 family protein [Actinomycetota bacterium]